VRKRKHDALERSNDDARENIAADLTLLMCSVIDEGGIVDLLVTQLKTAIRRLLDDKGVRGRVLDKVNRYGEVVIGVILERPAPPVAPGNGERADGQDTSRGAASDQTTAADGRSRR
jgi:hypothetical protein